MSEQGGKARGRGRGIDGKQQQQGRKPGNGNGNGSKRPGPGGPPPQQPQQQPKWPGAPQSREPAASGSSAPMGRGGSAQAPTAGPSVPRYATPTVSGSEGRASAHSVHSAVGDSRIRRGEDGNGREVQRGAIRNKRILTDILRTRPKDLVTKKGSGGKTVPLTTNYFRLLKQPTWHIYQYRVDFTPEIPHEGFRKKILNEQKAKFGGYLFDGTCLFITNKMESFEYVTKDRDDSPIKTNVRYVGEVSMTSAASIQVLNLILRKAMGGLNLQLIGRNMFDPVAKINIPNFNMQLWPGYLTSIRQHEVDILLCAEITNKVMRTETVLNIMNDIRNNNRNFRDAVNTEIIGMTVLTDYNNKTYRIDDIDWSKTPKDEFETKTGKESFIKYYSRRYSINIRDLNQPLLISKAKEKDLRGGVEQLIALIPELCRATGLSEKMRNDFKCTRAMSDYTRMPPDKRTQKLLEFNRRLSGTADSAKVLTEWNFQLEKTQVEVTGRILPGENIIFGGNSKFPAGPEVDWTKGFFKNSMYCNIALKRWVLIYPPRASREAPSFVGVMQNASRGMRFEISQPETIELVDDRQNTYSNALDKAINQNVQLIMIVVPNNNADRYSNIKKKCCVDRAIPTQVIIHRTITPKDGNPRSLMSVGTKVAIQLNCKLGGAPWMIDLPLSGLMTIGFDVCHDTRDKSKSYGALVATMDLKKSVKYFSAVTAHTNGEELSNEFTLNVTKAMKEYRNEHNTLPQRIIIYRDGVGEGQTNYVYEHEVRTLLAKLEEIYANAGVKEGFMLGFVVVSKRINTRIFDGPRNPPPGTVVDDIITLPERYDFFLVSQSCRQGTVSPTSYNVLYDTLKLSPDKIQILTYKQTHMYFNWCGATRVPAVCQYAHKLAFLVGQSIHQSPSNTLEKTLYFL